MFGIGAKMQQVNQSKKQNEHKISRHHIKQLKQQIQQTQRDAYRARNNNLRDLYTRHAAMQNLVRF